MKSLSGVQFQPGVNIDLSSGYMLRLASDAQHGCLYNSTIDGAEYRGYAGHIWKSGLAGATELARLTSSGLTVQSVAVPTVSSTDTLTNKTLTSPKINQILDTLGNIELNLTATASSVNYLNILNGTTGTDIQLQAAGSDTNTGINLVPKGTGVLKTNGVQVSDVSSTQTLTNKRVTPRINSITSSATPAINVDTTDQFNITALAVNITSMTSGLTGTPTDGQKLLIRITGTAARTITWGTSFTSSGTATLLAITATTKTHMVGLIYDSTVAKWVCQAVDATGY